MSIFTKHQRSSLNYLTLSIASFMVISTPAVFAAEESHATDVKAPAVKSKFFSPEMIEAIPKLSHLKDKNPGFNKIVLKLDGFPINEELILEINRPLGKSPDKYLQVTTFKIQEDGNYLTADGQTHPYFVGTCKGFLPGERINYRIRTEDGRDSYEGSGIPMPIIVKNEEDVVDLRAELLSIDPTVYIIELPTMEEGEEFDLISCSIGQTIKSKVIYNSKKPMHYSPTADSKSRGGTACFKIIRKSGEIIYIKLPWGTALDIYQAGCKCYPFHNTTQKALKK